MTEPIDWVAVAARDQGDRHDPAVLLLHGFTGTGEVWTEFASDLNGQHLRTIAPDLPGHGMAGLPPRTKATVEGFADQLTGLLGQLDATPASVLGYSLGARVALRLAIDHPEVVGRLALESPSAGFADPAQRAERREADERLADEIERDGVAAFIDRWERNPVFASHERLADGVAAQQRAIRRQNTAAGLAYSLRLAGQGAMEPLHDRLAQVSVPTLVIVGELDPVRARAEEVASGIPGASLAVVDGAGHTPHLERPDTFRQLVIDFLKEVPSA